MAVPKPIAEKDLHNLLI